MTSLLICIIIYILSENEQKRFRVKSKKPDFLVLNCYEKIGILSNFMQRIRKILRVVFEKNDSLINQSIILTGTILGVQNDNKTNIPKIWQLCKYRGHKGNTEYVGSYGTSS